MATERLEVNKQVTQKQQDAQLIIENSVQSLKVDEEQTTQNPSKVIDRPPSGNNGEKDQYSITKQTITAPPTELHIKNANDQNKL